MIKVLPFKGQVIDLLNGFQQEKNVSLLHSSHAHHSHGRFSFLGVNPFLVVEKNGLRSLQALREKFSVFKSRERNIHTPFASGIIGFISYDYGLYQHNFKVENSVKPSLPDVRFCFYDTIITIDHFEKILIISSTGLPEKGRYKFLRAKQQMDLLLKKLNRCNLNSVDSFSIALGSTRPKIFCQSNFSKEKYIQTVEKVLDHIRRGNVYQANIAQRFLYDLKERQVDPIKLYEKLMQLSPMPFSGFIDAGSYQILSSSPEQFLQLRNDMIQTRPMKGTRPRGASLGEDKKFKRELALNNKEKAELLMITDLERNDLGRVCDYASIKVRNLRTIEKYKTVYQSSATVVGKVKKCLDGFDVLSATFPGGSVTGCPKIRAMEIINQLEPQPRRIYTGCMGYMSFNGDMDFNILIRTILLQKQKACFYVGAGIVADSDPLKEYQETLTKAYAMKKCLEEI